MTSPRVAPGLLSWAAWDALRSADAVLAPAGHPLLPALDEAGIGYQVAERIPEPPGADGTVVWLPEPGDDPPLPPGATLLRGSADLPGAHVIDLVATMDRLRVECPWDARQTHQTLAPHLLEEPYEALEALESGDGRPSARNSVTCCCRWCSTPGSRPSAPTATPSTTSPTGSWPSWSRRHPHVFADVTVSGADEVHRNWDDIKRAERAEKKERAERAGVPAGADGPPSSLDGVPFGQPALALAAQLQRRAARAGVPDELARLEGDPGSPDPAGRLGGDAANCSAWS